MTDPTNAEVEAAARAVHQAYLDTCDRLGWTVKAANRVPYDALDEPAKELDRATVRAVLAAVLPDHDARLRVDVVEEIAGVFDQIADTIDADPRCDLDAARRWRDAAAVIRDRATAGGTDA